MKKIDKETDPIKYVKSKLKEINQNEEIPEEYKKLLYNLGKKVFLMNKTLDETDLYYSVDYALRPFDLLYQTISEGIKVGDKKLFETTLSYTENVIEDIKLTQCHLNKLYDASTSLEARVVFNRLLIQAKKSNKKP